MYNQQFTQAYKHRHHIFLTLQLLVLLYFDVTRLALMSAVIISAPVPPA